MVTLFNQMGIPCTIDDVFPEPEVEVPLMEQWASLSAAIDQVANADSEQIAQAILRLRKEQTRFGLRLAQEADRQIGDSAEHADGSMTVSDRIRSRLKALDMNQSDLAKSAGVSKSTVTFWLSGKNGMNGDNLVALAVALKCSPTWLATGEG